MAGNANTKTSRCWPGYEPVPGKSEHEEGSCRKKPKSRNGGEAADRETSRKKQVALGGARAEQAKKAVKAKSAGKKASTKKRSAKKATTAKAVAEKSPKRPSSKKTDS